jgi:hypothetical protein
LWELGEVVGEPACFVRDEV